jgi:uncharacterized protein YbjT (DUF2867 family)
MNKTITIIGATGRVGSKTVKNLLSKGHTLRLVARTKQKLSDFAKEPGVEIHPGSVLDIDFLTKAIKGSDVVMMMMPADFSATNIGAYQDQVALAECEAIKRSGVKYVLNLSSVGGHTEEKTGIVAGLARQERRLNNLTDVNILHLRPSYFMENLLGNIGMIKGININGSPLIVDKRFPIIATEDIAKVAAQKLESLNWTGSSVQPLLGPKDYTMKEVTSALGKAIGNPELKYVQFPYDQAKQAMMQMGLNESFADAYNGLSEGINEGVFNLEKRDANSTTPTTIEQFADTVFVKAFNS